LSLFAKKPGNFFLVGAGWLLARVLRKFALARARDFLSDCVVVVAADDLVVVVVGVDENSIIIVH
jgi:hypothetical protein